MPLSPGDRFGPYEIVSRLGEGGMGEVWKARDTRLDRMVAVKVCKQEFSERFGREARAVAALSHPNICRLYDVGANYLVMELLEGETLAALLQKGALPLPLTLRYGAEIAGGLSAAHAKALIHRDLKPSNVMITKAGAKLLDFGLAKSESDETLTASHMVAGTPAYMAPEQRAGTGCDARSDIYAIGLILYEMAAGKRASPTRAPVEPPELERIAGTCLADDPDDRFQSACDLKRSIDWCKAPASAPVAHRTWSGWRLALLSAAILAAICGWAAWSLKPASDPPPALQFTIAPPSETVYQFGAMAGGSAISPDGRTLAFAAIHQGQPKLMLRPLDSLEFRVVPGTEGAHTPFWSPDSANLAFTAGGQLKRVRVSGGAPQLITSSEGAYGAWNENGFILIGALRQPILRVSSGGGDPLPLTRLTPEDLGHLHPCFLPGGKHFIYHSASGAQGKSGIFAGRLDATAESQEPRFLLNADSQAVYAPSAGGHAGWLLFLRDGALRARKFDAANLRFEGAETIVGEQVRQIKVYNRGDFSASNNGLLALGRTGYAMTSLAWFDRAGLPLETVSEPALHSGINLTADERHAVVNRTTGPAGGVWLADLTAKTSVGLGLERSHTYSPVAARGGGFYIFTNMRGANSDLVRKPAGQAEVEVLKSDVAPLLGLDLTADDRRLLFAEWKNMNNPNLWVLELSPAGHPVGEPVPVAASEFAEPTGQFSPDGRFVVYVSNESMREEVYVRPFPGPGSRIRISTAGGRYPRWRNPGEIVYLGLDGKLFAAPVKTSGAGLVAGQPQALFALRRLAFGTSHAYDVTRDGRRILALQPQPLQLNGEDAFSILQQWQPSR